MITAPNLIFMLCRLLYRPQLRYYCIAVVENIAFVARLEDMTEKFSLIKIYG